MCISAVAFSATIMNGAISRQLVKPVCLENIEIMGHPVFELQKDRSYRNDLNARIVRNEEDQAWFITGLGNKGRDQ